MLVVRVLGAVRAEVDGRPVAIGSAKQRLLLAVLASRPGGLTRGRLVDALWPEEPPPSATATLLGYVSRLRAALGSGAVESRGENYRLVADDTDAGQFEATMRSDPDVAALEQALALWEGDAYGELADHPYLVGEAARLNELRTDARLRLATAYLDAGETARPISMLEAIVGDDPVREDAWVSLVRALLHAGRSAEGARAANRCRRALTEVGLEPGAALVAAEAQALDDRAGPAGAREADVRPGPMRYTRSGTVHLAYQVVGGGPVDLVMSSYGSVSIDAIWDSPPFTSFVTRLASSCRVVLYDTHGIGLSDPIDVAAPPSLEQQSDDLKVVVEAAQARRAVVVGIGDGGPTAITYAVRHRESILGLVLVNTYARAIQDDDYPFGMPRAAFDAIFERSVVADSKRETSHVLRNHAPSVAGDAEFREWWDRAGRRGASPATASALFRVRYDCDLRPLLSEITVPTLVMHRQRARAVPIAFGEYVAERIPGAQFVEIAGADQSPFTEGADEIADLITAFATEVASRGGPAVTR